MTRLLVAIVLLVLVGLRQRNVGLGRRHRVQSGEVVGDGWFFDAGGLWELETLRLLHLAITRHTKILLLKACLFVQRDLTELEIKVIAEDVGALPLLGLDVDGLDWAEELI